MQIMKSFHSIFNRILFIICFDLSFELQTHFQAQNDEIECILIILSVPTTVSSYKHIFLLDLSKWNECILRTLLFATAVSNYKLILKLKIMICNIYFIIFYFSLRMCL